MPYVNLPNLGLMQGWAAAEDDWGLSMNTNLKLLDALVQGQVISGTISDPPATPSVGHAYIIGPTATGDWAGEENKIAIWIEPVSPDTSFTAQWSIVEPKTGWIIWINDVSRFYRAINLSGVITWHKLPNFGVDDSLLDYNRYVLEETGTSYTIEVDISSAHLELTNASAITLTLPNDLPKGFHLFVTQCGAGQITFSPASGATLRNRQSHTKTAGQWAVAELYVRSNVDGVSAEYVLSRDTAA